LPANNEYYSMSCPVCVGGGSSSCPAPEDLYGEYTWNADGTYGTTLTWPYEAPIAPISEWLYYDNGTYATSVGAGGTLYWGSMFPTSAIAPYDGTSLTKVAVCTSYACTATLNIYYGGANPNAGTLVHTQQVNFTGTNDFMEVNLSTALPLDVTQNLWITFYQSGESYPADACTDTGDANNRWVSVDGSQWLDLSTAGLPGYGWMIRGFVTNEAKGGEIVELPAFKGNVGGELSHGEVVSKELSQSFMHRDVVDHYNIYRGTSQGNYSLIAEVAGTANTYFDDLTGNAGIYYYQVTAVYGEGADECESDPAMAYESTNDYVIVEVTSVDENGVSALYPNPTSGNVTINAQNMSRVTVVSVLGQVVYDAEVEGDEYVINMAQFNAGVYMVRIATESGVSTQRVTVVK
ncbi:MAG: T9SS type A sorting domain-containing protein, partial [Bacteroidaceae bacterium]|nr:T9SS type A sorting domain-containing protein [Bacteroidaceae bacterium]